MFNRTDLGYGTVPVPVQKAYAFGNRYAVVLRNLSPGLNTVDGNLG